MRETASKVAVDAMLADVCRGREFEVPRVDVAAAELARAARFHRIAPLAYVALRDRAASTTTKDARTFLEELRTDRDKTFMHHLRVTAVLDQLARLLDGLDWLAFKGPVLSEVAHPVHGLRHYKDLDILVAPSQLREALDRLFARGWNVVQPNDALENPVIPGQIDLASPAGILLDLHWSMVISNPQRRRYPIDTVALLARRVPLTIGATQLWTLDPLDMLVHVCHHAALSGATRLVYLVDADQLARRVTNWNLVVDRATEWGATAHVWLVLARAHRVLGTPVPNDLRVKLGLPASIGLITSLVDRRWPIPTLRDDASWPRLAARAARPSGLRTLAIMARNGFLRVAPRPWLSTAPQRRVPANKTAIDSYLAAVEDVTRHSTQPS